MQSRHCLSRGTELVLALLAHNTCIAYHVILSRCSDELVYDNARVFVETISGVTM